jgi:hypothetical protein
LLRVFLRDAIADDKHCKNKCFIMMTNSLSSSYPISAQPHPVNNAQSQWFQQRSDHSKLGELLTLEAY